MEQLSFSLTPQDHFYTVSELTGDIKQVLGTTFADIRVIGEISGKRDYPSGHIYFSLKDAGSLLSCVIFRSTARYLKFKPEDGLSVIARGSLDVQEMRGQYQFIVSGLQPQGAGALQLAFDQLKRKLEAEGLFAAERKRPLPKFPRRIGIVTSPAGAAIRDMLTVLERRCAGVHVRLYPTLVQGDGAAEGIAEAIGLLGSSGWPDLLIVGRGGGSLEDLWAFNEEIVARAIVACPVPVISAVGHETDFTIADFVADLRAPTPSAAAELAVPNQADLLDRIDTAALRVTRAVRYNLSVASRRVTEQGTERALALLHRRLGRAGQTIDDLDQRLRRPLAAWVESRRQAYGKADRALRQFDPRLKLAKLRERRIQSDSRLEELANRALVRAQRRLNPLTVQLQALSPLQVLNRGYSILETEDRRVVKRPADAPLGTALTARLAEGQIRVEVTAQDSEA